MREYAKNKTKSGVGGWRDGRGICRPGHGPRHTQEAELVKSTVCRRDELAKQSRRHGHGPAHHPERDLGRAGNAEAPTNTVV